MRFTITIFGLLLAGAECCRRGIAELRSDRVVTAALLGESSQQQVSAGSDTGRSLARSLRHLPVRTQTRLLGIGAGLLLGAIGLRLVGPIGLAAGAVVGSVLPRMLRDRREQRLIQELERQLAEVSESAAMAVRSGLSIAQALEFAAEEAESPMSAALSRFIHEQRLGTPFEEALRTLADELGTPDADLFALIIAIHARSGGNLAGALDDVSSTIRHRIAVRRELLALSAQGRISGSVLGSLPIAFFLVLAATSRQDLGPVYRSPAGILMISAGLAMEGLAFLWIRRLLRVDA